MLPKLLPRPTADLIIQCFMSHYISSLVKAFRVYVTPVLEYFSILLVSYNMKDIIALKGVQRRTQNDFQA